MKTSQYNEIVVNFLNRLESRLERIVNNNIEKYQFFKDVLSDLIDLIPTAEKGTAWEYRDDFKVCIAQQGYSDEFIEKLILHQDCDDFFKKEFDSQIVETTIVNTSQSKISNAPQEVKKMFDTYVPKKEFKTLRGTVNLDNQNFYEIYLDNFSNKQYSQEEIKIFSTYLKLTELFLREYSLKHELKLKNKKIESLISSLPIVFAEFDQNLNLKSGNKALYENFSNFLKDNQFNFLNIHKNVSNKVQKVISELQKNKIVSLDFYTEQDDKRKYYNSIIIPFVFENETSYYVFIQDNTLKYRERQTFINSLEALAKILATMAEYYTQDTQEHIERMRNYAETFCKILHIKNEAYFVGIKLGAMLHDIGKFRIDPRVLNKPSRLTKEEFEYIKMHVNYGIEMLTPFEEYISKIDKQSFKKTLYNIVRNIILYHHENYDGTGYLGLEKIQIPFEARFVHIIDVYDALTHKRVYKDKYSQDEALEIMLNEKEKYDPFLLKIFIENKSMFPP
ncbi:MAG: HD domain-containing phosphohydrolase [Candidatus Woesearchaeota archaeon]